MTAPALVWHYTVEQEKLESILRDGCLWPAIVGIGGNEKPVTWFSSHPRYEPTAIKWLGSRDGTTRAMTLAEQIERFGCARIGIDRGDALPWARLVKAAKISPTMQRKLIRAAREVGGNASEWFGVMGPVPRDLWRAVEVMRRGQWTSYEETAPAAGAA